MTGSSSAADRHAAGEALRVEDLQQRREAVRMAIVRRGGQEQSMLEAAGDLPDRLGELAIDGLARPLDGAA